MFRYHLPNHLVMTSLPLILPFSVFFVAYEPKITISFSPKTCWNAFRIASVPSEIKTSGFISSRLSFYIPSWRAQNTNMKFCVFSFERTAIPNEWNWRSRSVVPTTRAGNPCHINLYVASAWTLLDLEAICKSLVAPKKNETCFRHHHHQPTKATILLFTSKYFHKKMLTEQT